MGNLLHDSEKMQETVAYVRNSKRKKRKKVNNINTRVNTLILRQRERVTKWPHNVEHLVIESKMTLTGNRQMA